MTGHLWISDGNWTNLSPSYEEVLVVQIRVPLLYTTYYTFNPTWPNSPSHKHYPHIRTPTRRPNMLRPLILAAGLVVDAQPTAPAMVGTGTLAPALWLNGEPVDKLSRQQSVVLPGIPTAPRVHFEPQEDVLTSATKLLHEIGVESNTTLGARSQKVPVKCRRQVGRGWPVIVDSGSLTLNYTTNLDSCKKSDPVIIKKEALFICSVESEIPRIHLNCPMLIFVNRLLAGNFFHSHRDQYYFLWILNLNFCEGWRQD